MNIGNEVKTVVIEPVEDPVPRKAPRPQPEPVFAEREQHETVTSEPEKVTA